MIMGSVCLLAIIGGWTLANRIQTQNDEIVRLKLSIRDWFRMIG